MMPFGKHKGKRVADVPPEYLRWAVDHCELDETLYAEMMREMGAESEPAVVWLERRLPHLRTELLKTVRQWAERESWRNAIHHRSDTDVTVIVGEVAAAVTAAIDSAVSTGLEMVAIARTESGADILPLVKAGG